MFTKTLAQWKTRVSVLCDIVGQVGTGNTFRHQTSYVDEIADETYRRTRGEVTRRGFKEFLTRGATAALPTTAAITGEQYATVAYPTGATHIRGFDVLESGIWRRLKHLDGWCERRDHQDSNVSVFADSLRPYAWDVLSHGSVATTVLTAGTIAIFPIPTSGDYAIWYLPEWTSIAGNDTYLFLYREQCWYDYHVAQGVMEICGLRDNDSAGRYRAAKDMSDASEKAIGEFTADETRDGVRSWTRDVRHYHR
jgi:hypothetical protein